MEPKVNNNKSILKEHTAEEWMSLALLEEDRGNFKAALGLHLNAVRSCSTDLRFKNAYAACCAMNKKYYKAIDLLCEILDIDPDYRAALENLGKTLFYMGLNANDIKGWFSACEAGQLYRVIQAIEDPAPRIVELGSCFGLSSMIIACALRNKPQAEIYCVDAWEGDGSSVFGKTREFIQKQADEGNAFFEMFKDNMVNAGVFQQLTPIRGYTTEVVKSWTKKADLVFVDADHSYEGVRADVRDWMNFIKVGGSILMHDVTLKLAGSKEDSGPGLVIHEFLAKGSDFGRGTLVDTLYLSERLK